MRRVRLRQLGPCEWCRKPVFDRNEDGPAKWNPLSVDVVDRESGQEFIAYVHFGCYVERGRELPPRSQLVLP